MFNVFAGLDDISRWYLSPSQAYSCYSSWQNYHQDTSQERDFIIVSENLNKSFDTPDPYEENINNKLGKVSPICTDFKNLQNNINQPNNKAIFVSIQSKQTQVVSLK